MQTSDIGLIGLGTMGAMLSLNIAEKGFRISVYNRTGSKTDTFMKNAGDLASSITPTKTLEDFVASLTPPRNIILMVPVGQPVDDQIAALRPLLDATDMIIDAGNANFHDTNRRAADAVSANLPYLGIGVSGGEEGARFGPSIMGGGTAEDWGRVSQILEAISAKYDGRPCATLMGPAGAGHFVKTVHNGIEYADMQLIAETYGIMRDGLNLSAAECASVFDGWNTGVLESYLVEITGKVSAAIDPDTKAPVLDIILDRAGQKGTGRWTVIESQQLGAAVPTIEAAVAARNLSAALEKRQEGAALFGDATTPDATIDLSAADLEAALIAGKIMCYAQGFDLLMAAAGHYGWHLPMKAIAEVWREGCIIRSSMLNDMAKALDEAPDRNLMFAPYFAGLMEEHEGALRRVVARSVEKGLAVPAMAASISYFDTMRASRTFANMIQAQRDFFGAHSFERIDSDGAFHGPWGDAH